MPATIHTLTNSAYSLQVCGTTPCRLNGSQAVVDALENHLGIHMGQTTPDGMFTLGEMECMGCCVNAPMIAVADFSKGVDGYSYNYFEDLTTDDAISIADTYKAGLLSCFVQDFWSCFAAHLHARAYGFHTGHGMPLRNCQIAMMCTLFYVFMLQTALVIRLLLSAQLARHC